MGCGRLSYASVSVVSVFLKVVARQSLFRPRISGILPFIMLCTSLLKALAMTLVTIMTRGLQFLISVMFIFVGMVIDSVTVLSYNS